MKPQTAAGSTQPNPKSARGKLFRKGRDAPKSAAVVRRLVAIGLWLLVCFSSLCFPDDIWDRWLPDEKKR